MKILSRPSESWMTTSEAKKELKMNTPMFVRRMEQFHFEVRRNPRDLRIRYVNILEIKQKLGIED